MNKNNTSNRFFVFFLPFKAIFRFFLFLPFKAISKFKLEKASFAPFLTN